MEKKDAAPEGRMERKKKENRQKIVSVAMDLFKRQGFNNTTMEQIAEEADVARKTLYNYFPVKEAIADEYVKCISAGLADDNLATILDLPDTRSRLLTALNNTYAWVEDNPEITGICLGYRLKNMYQSSVNDGKETGTQSIMAEIIRLGQYTGEINPDLSVKQLVIYIDVLRGSMILDWLNDSSRIELRKEITKLIDLFLYGASNR